MKKIYLRIFHQQEDSPKHDVINFENNVPIIKDIMDHVLSIVS